MWLLLTKEGCIKDNGDTTTDLHLTIEIIKIANSNQVDFIILYSKFSFHYIFEIHVLGVIILPFQACLLKYQALQIFEF